MVVLAFFHAMSSFLEFFGVIESEGSFIISIISFELPQRLALVPQTRSSIVSFVPLVYELSVVT
jgi:hypothetical protein